MVKKEAKWMELKKKAPELAIAILEDFTEDIGGNSHGLQIMRISSNLGISKCYSCGTKFD
jgi:hypothetical protein